MKVRTVSILALLATTLVCSTAVADEPITERNAWEGRVDFFMTGTPLAVDTDGDFRVDTFDLPASIPVESDDVTGQLVAAWLYWGGSTTQPAGAPCAGDPDDQVTTTVPGGAPESVTGTCYCSDGGASSYDVWVCRSDITTHVDAAGGSMVGSFLVDDYDGLASNVSTHNASAALLLVFSGTNLPPRRVVAFDGNVDLQNELQTLSLTGIDVGTVPSGDLTYYVLEGDIAGAGDERVTVQGLPGGTPTTLSDAVNPADNPFNQTVNTTTPAQTGLVGVDIDQFDITAALASMDTQIDVTISAGNDKFWLAATVLGVDQVDPALGQNSAKEVVLFDDRGVDGEPTPGDTLRYTIRLVNDGNEAGTVDVTDALPTGIASSVVIDAAGGTDVSNATEIRVEGVTVPAGASREIIVDMEIGDVDDLDEIVNVASWSAPLEGGTAGSVESDPVVVRADFDDDSIFDTDDNCPMAANRGQRDADGDGVGDACDDDFTPDMGTGADAGGSDAGVRDAGRADAGTADGGGFDGGNGFDAGGDSTPDGGMTAGGDAGADRDAGGSTNGSGPTGGKGSLDSGCCSTVDDRPLPVGFALFLVLLIALGRRHARGTKRPRTHAG